MHLIFAPVLFHCIYAQPLSVLVLLLHQYAQLFCFYVLLLR